MHMDVYTREKNRDVDMATVLDLDRKAALKFFMKAESYCTLPLPS